MSASTVLFENATHRNVLLEDFSSGLAVQANQHVIVDGPDVLLLDPGGHKVYSKVMGATFALAGKAKLKHLFLSHQDPDIVAAVNGWLMSTDAEAHLSSLWIRFVAHFGIDKLVEHRLRPIPDEGGFLRLGSTDLMIIPAHFLHSPGNFHLYDPVSRILYSGDLGASLGAPETQVTNFAAHVPFMEGFHRRYMASNRVLKAWVKMVRALPIEVIAPQHGAWFKGPQVAEFLDWCENLSCGVDIAESFFKLPVQK